MSTKMPPSATASNTAAAMPGWSATPLIVTRAWVSSSAMSSIVSSSIFCSRATTATASPRPCALGARPSLPRSAAPFGGRVERERLVHGPQG